MNCCDCGKPLTEEQKRVAKTLAKAREEAFGEYDTTFWCEDCNQKRIEAASRAIYDENDGEDPLRHGKD